VEWRGKRAVVVGASSGLGEALARRLSAAGAKVALVARRASELERVARDLRAAGGEAWVFVHDVARTSEAPAVFEAVVAALGGLDVIVHAAGVMHPVAEGEYPPAQDLEVLSVNLLGAVAWLDRAAAHFEAQRSGTILGISSVAGERGRRGNPAYAASKAGLTTFLEALRNRCTRYGVNVVTVKPGFLDTAMTRGKPGLFWLLSADDAAARCLALAARGNSASGYVPRRWGLVMLVIRLVPSFVFRRLNF
jgi:NAD(P)-dependent dehydrogenase (short-subunit alcohol dehydrogenase family)